MAKKKLTKKEIIAAGKKHAEISHKFNKECDIFEEKFYFLFKKGKELLEIQKELDGLYDFVDKWFIEDYYNEAAGIPYNNVFGYIDLDPLEIIN